MIEDSFNIEAGGDIVGKGVSGGRLVREGKYKSPIKHPFFVVFFLSNVVLISFFEIVMPLDCFKKMSEGGYKIRWQGANHFLTFATVEWVDVFTRKEYCDILLDSIRHCQTNKGLVINAWCLMSNHIHLVARAANKNLSSILCDFKKYTSKQIINAIATNKGESRKEWMLRIFREQGTINSRNKEFQFWRQDNHPVELFSPAFTVQKINYIHQNPVRAGIVEKAENYVYSSARDYHFGKRSGLLEVKFL